MLAHWWGIGPAIAGTSAAFGIAHYRQGWRAVAFITGFGVLLQLFVFQVGNLYMAMIVHAAYDFIVGVHHVLVSRTGQQSVSTVESREASEDATVGD